MNMEHEKPSYTNLMRAAGACLAVFILSVGRDILIPITIAALISFVVAPWIKRLRRHGVPNVIASVAVTLTLGVVLVGLAVLMSSQLIDFTRRVPEYRDNLVQRVRSVKLQAGSSMTSLNATVASIKHEMNATTNPSTAESQPVRVQLVSGAEDWLARGTDLLLPAIQPLTTIGIVILLVFFISMNHDLLMIKGRRLAYRLDLYQAGEAVQEASSTMGRYLRMQLLVNAICGSCVGITMFAIGLPNALMWGIFAMLLRYLPYIGPLVSFVMPTLLSIAIFPDWSRPVLFVGVLLFLEIILNGLLEPMLYGHSTGVSSLGVVVASLFWGWLWGPAGLLLAMPITSCLVVIGKHLRPLEAIAELLGVESPPADPSASESPGEMQSRLSRAGVQS